MAPLRRTPCLRIVYSAASAWRRPLESEHPVPPAQNYGELVQIVYISRSLVRGTTAEVAAELADILAVSRQHNLREDITGALFFNGRGFAQTLEGAPLAIADCYARILRDKRHEDVRLIQHEYIGARGFAGWAMAYFADVGGAGFTLSPNFLHEIIARNADAAPVLELMRHLMRGA
ncbi:hypothetical protein CH337_03525 [Rhodoblastus acidophilus]|nr:hypothetical protein CKO16_14255 [Rhodoblastus acidophilus]RAI23109.1 hypothetical protein CH337_03525 [Rhodoblastus acidophilus]